MLEITGLRAGYGRGPDVLHDASLTVQPAQIAALIGLNGAGKSTMVRAVTGLLPTRAGRVTFEGRDVTGLSTDARARLGIVLVPEGRELCPTMTVEENLALGTVPLPRKSRRRLAAESSERVHELFPVLVEKRHDPAGSLSGGQQQMVAVGRALMSSPRLLILDEPSLGLAPLLVREIFEAVARLNRTGLSVLVVEQNAALAMAYSHQLYHLELGRLSRTDAAGQERSLLRAGSGLAGSGLADRDEPAAALTLPVYRQIGTPGRWRRRPEGVTAQ